jgi:hypothetical protein
MGVVLVVADNPWVSAPPDPHDASTVEPSRAMWGRIARRFHTVGEGLRFQFGESELPASSRPGERFERYVAAIRAASPERFVYLPLPVEGAGDASASSYAVTRYEPQALTIERFDARVGVALSYWEPQVYSMQLPDQGLRVPFPGVVPDPGSATLTHPDADYVALLRAQAGRRLDAAQIIDDLARIASWNRGLSEPRQLYLSRFGVLEDNAAADTQRYVRAVVEAAARHDMGWAIYDYESGRAIRGADGKPTPALLGLGLRPGTR